MAMRCSHGFRRSPRHSGTRRSGSSPIPTSSKSVCRTCSGRMTSPSRSGWPEWRFVAVGCMPTSEDWPITWPPRIFPPAKKHALVSEWSRPPRVFSRGVRLNSLKPTTTVLLASFHRYPRRVFSPNLPESAKPLKACSDFDPGRLPIHQMGVQPTADTEAYTAADF